MKLDLTERLKSEKPSIIINGKEYEINNSSTVLLKIAESEKNNTSETMIDILKLLVGEENLEEIMSKLSMESFSVFATYVMGLARGSSQEEIEKQLKSSPTRK